MKIQKNKVLSIIALVLLTLSLFMTTIGSIRAETIPTNAFLSVNPNPVGVNQEADIVVWLAPIMRNVGDFFNGLEVEITKPDGTKETKGPFTSWAMGGIGFSYTPTMVGDYSLQFFYPGETFASTGDTYLASQSPVTTLVVQETPVSPWPYNPLPTDPWTRPIDGENRNWAAISGNWLQEGYNLQAPSFSESGTSGFNPYSTAPRAPHIMWTKDLGLGGLVGGEYESMAYYTGLSYDTQVLPPIVINGRIYYETGPRDPIPGFVCVDLRTGEQLWENEEGSIDVGQTFFDASPNAQGVHAFLWDTTGSTWDVYDAFTGKWLFNFENARSTRYIEYGPDGAIFAYVLNGGNQWFVKWNQTKAYRENGVYASFTPTVFNFALPYEQTLDWTLGIEWNVTIPDRTVFGNQTYGEYTVAPGARRLSVPDNVLIANADNDGLLPYWWVGYDTNTGQELWADDSHVEPESRFNMAIGEGKYAVFNFQTSTWTAYNIRTGAKLWTSEPLSYPWGSYSTYNAIIENGKLYANSWDGNTYAINAETGNIDWSFSSGDSGTETVFGTWPFWSGPMGADGVLFYGTGEETPTQPLTRGGRIFAIDEETGEEIWHLKGYMSFRAIADGYLLAYNGYDNRLYSIGKGPSATTVTAPKTEVMQGQKVVIEGTVTDQSAGAMGTPAISDEDMGPWMEYLYMQQPAPMSAKGVDVSIDVIDANGNYRNIGTATSDISGVYSLVWEPDIPGKYTVVATFLGSESYGSSFAQTSLYVEEAPEATPPPETTPAPPTDTYVLGMGIAAIIAIVVMGLLILMKVGKK